MIARCAELWQIYLKAHKFATSKGGQKHDRETLQTNGQEPTEINYTYEERDKQVEMALASSSDFLRDAVKRFKPASAPVASTSAQPADNDTMGEATDDPPSGRRRGAFTVSESGMPVGGESNLGIGYIPAASSSKKRKVPDGDMEQPFEEEPPEDEHSFEPFTEIGEVNTLDCSAPEMAAWFFRYLVEPIGLQGHSKTSTYFCDACRVLPAGLNREPKDWRIPAIYRQHLGDMHRDPTDVLNGYMQLGRPDKKRFYCPLCMERSWAKRSQAKEHLVKQHGAAYERVMRGESLMDDIRLSQVQSDQENGELQAKWSAFIALATTYDDGIDKAKSYVKVYDSQKTNQAYEDL